MGAYQIIQLEQLSGIKAHTIRIWEKRYKLINPKRTSTNIRYYDDEQLRKLLNIATLLSHGFKISHLASLKEAEINQLVKNLLDSASEDSICLSFINELTISMLAYNEQGFEKTFSAIITRFGIYDGMLRVIYPFLQKTGLIWSVSEAIPAQEHFASNIIRRKLMSAIDGLNQPTRTSKKFLLFLPEGELHEIALLFSDYIIRKNGYRSINLGQDVPLKNLKEVIAATSPTHALTFFISRREEEEIKQSVKNMLAMIKDLHFLISGTGHNLQMIKSSKRISLLTNPTDLISLF